MPGFEFRYRTRGGQPTVRSFVVKNTGTLSRGDMLNLEDGAVDLGAAGDTALLGAALETIDGEAGATEIRVIVDADAVYAVDDPHPRAAGDRLELTGATGAQGVAAVPASELLVAVESPATAPTLVSIEPTVHHRVLEGEGRAHAVGGDLNAAVARAVVRWYRTHTGRGPTKAQAFYRGDAIVVILREMMTRGELSLIAHGRTDAVTRLRTAFQAAMRADLVPEVERLTGAKVVAFMSANNVDADMAVEVFVVDQPIWSGPPGGPSADQSSS